MRSWIGFVVLGLALLLGGCSVDSDSLQARRGLAPGLDAGFPDVVPGMDSVAAEAPRPASDSLLPDAGLALEVRSPSLDTGPAPDLRPVEPDLRPADVLPAPDLAPECPYAAWTKPPASAPAETRWTSTTAVPDRATCFTLCGTLTSLQLAQLPFRSVQINGTAALPLPNEVSGSLPGTVQAIDGMYVIRISAGDPGLLVVTGWPTTTCPL